jgi:hypothetical protein
VYVRGYAIRTHVVCTLVCVGWKGGQCKFIDKEEQ